MALYYYQALDKEGKKLSGYLDSASVQGVREALIKQQLYPIFIEPARGQAESWWKQFFQAGVSVKEKILFTKQLAVLLKSGVQLLQALELLTEYFEGRFKTILVTVKDDVKEGRSFAESLNKYPKIFDTIYVQLVRAGEASGKLETILERLTVHMERQEEIRKEIAGALRMPMIQLIGAVLVVIGMLRVVVPPIAENFMEQGQALPMATQIVVGMSNFLTNHYLMLIVLLMSIVGGFSYWKSTKRGRRLLDELRLRLPIIKYFAKTSAIVQFSRTLGTLLEGGVNLPESLDIVCKIIDNQVLTDALNQAKDKIIKQGNIAQYLKQTNIFPPIAIYLINTGEQSGKLDTMLLTVADTYEGELRELADNLTALIGPLLLVVMAFIVGFIIMSVMLPIMQMSQIAGL